MILHAMLLGLIPLIADLFTEVSLQRTCVDTIPAIRFRPPLWLRILRTRRGRPPPKHDVLWSTDVLRSTENAHRGGTIHFAGAWLLRGGPAGSALGCIPTQGKHTTTAGTSKTPLAWFCATEGLNEPQEPLLQVPKGAQRSTITRNMVSNCLKAIAVKMGLPESDYASHSARIGGATSLLHAGADPHAIRL